MKLLTRITLLTLIEILLILMVFIVSGAKLWKQTYLERPVPYASWVNPFLSDKLTLINLFMSTTAPTGCPKPNFNLEW